MTVDSRLQQHTPFSDLIDSTEPQRPRWLPDEDLPAEGWHLYQSGDFPILQDKALIEEEARDA